MLATSWNAKGLVLPIWRQLKEPRTYKREHLAKLTGIPAPNLSSLNTGEMPMTMNLAERITKAVPGTTIHDLGAPVELVGDAEPNLVLGRLASVEVRIEQILAGMAMAGIRVPSAEEAARYEPDAQPQRPLKRRR